jgi:D-alanine-D-alanine ligase
MPRIGLAYNLKPEATAPSLAVRAEDEGTLGDDAPPSPRRDATSRNAEPTLAAGSGLASPSEPASVAPATDDDEFAEWDDRDTIDAVARALSALGDVIPLEADEHFPERLRRERPDIVFNMAEGLHGPNREAHVPAICEFFGIPYSGSDPFTLALCLDKARTKEILSHHAIPTAPFLVVRDERDLETLHRRLGSHAEQSAAELLGLGPRSPVFTKPLHEGSSKGITERNLCRDGSELVAQVAFLLERYRQPVLCETYLPGAEFTCAVLGNGDGARLLPIVGMNFDALPEGALPVYGFEAKWVWDRPERPLEIFQCPARIDDALAASIERVVLDAYRVLGCRDWSRIDVRLDADGVPNVVEVNPLPGILPDPADNSCFPKAARAAGLGYDELIQSCLRHAAERQGIDLAPARRAGAHPRSESRVAAQW